MNNSENSNGRDSENLESDFWYFKNKLVILSKSLENNSPKSSEERNRIISMTPSVFKII